ncbi:hypothetical protein F6X53_29755 [Methylobacterium soli]|uniref:Uncharacterized protein n=1 Tax=Methylobacterium soli TaxID=553447 RepID=A0A6L3SP33_9HYPH|nr:hypothetical protein F6X53_29755 [Methylobacterium soli]GJE44613.1 hypothetical protein AEGHOMDF_3802 [Methylobacterium soli]
MLREWALSLTIPAPLRHRRLGHVREGVLLLVRSRRCRAAWDWELAPFGEAERHRRLIHRLVAFRDWGAARARRPRPGS